MLGNDCRADCNTGNTQLRELMEIVRGDAADGNEGEWDFLLGFGGVLGAGDVGFLFGLGGEHRAGGDVGGAGVEGGGGLGEGVGGDADDFVVAEEFSGVLAGEVGLAEVDAVGVGEEGDVGAVVDDGEGAVLAAFGGEDFGAAEEFGVWEGFLAELDAEARVCELRRPVAPLLQNLVEGVFPTAE